MSESDSQKCYECDAPSEHEHYVVPESVGGTRPVPLCDSCFHKDAHDHGLPIAIEVMDQAIQRLMVVRGSMFAHAQLMGLDVHETDAVGRVIEAYERMRRGTHLKYGIKEPESNN